MADNMKWAPADDARLSKLYRDEGHRISDVADAMGLHRQQVMRRARRLGLVRQSGRVWTDEEISYLKARLQDLGYEGVGEALGKSAEAVRLISRRMDLPSPRPRDDYWTDELTETVIKRLYEGFSYTEISLEVGRTAEACRYRVKVCGGVDRKKVKQAQVQRRKELSATIPKPKRWTGKEFDQLNAHVDAGDSWEKIGKAIGRTPEACRYQWKRLQKQIAALPF